MKPNSKWLWTALITGALAVAAFGVAVWYGTGPRHQGRTASEWFQDMFAMSTAQGLPNLNKHPPGAPRKTMDAFQAMDERGIEFLLHKYFHTQTLAEEYYRMIAIRLRRFIRLPIRSMNNRSQTAHAARYLLLGIGTNAIPATLEHSYSETPSIRAKAARLLGELGPGNPAAQDRLVSMLLDPVDQVVFQALEVFWMTAPNPDTALPAVLPFLSHRDKRLRIEASYIIGSLPPRPQMTLHHLMTALSDTDHVVRANAARAIGFTDTQRYQVLRLLENQLEDSSELARIRAAEALSRLKGPDLQTSRSRVVSELRQASRANDPYYRLIALNGFTALELKVMDEETVIRMFHDLMSKQGVYYRYDAIEGLQTYLSSQPGPHPPELIELLFTHRHDPNGMIRKLSQERLEELENKTAPVSR